MRHKTAQLLSFIAMLLVLGCEHDSFDIDITIEKDLYFFNSSEQPKATLTNRSAQDVYLVMGSYVGFEQHKNGKWVDFTPWFIVDGAGASFPLAPDKSISTEVAYGYFLPEDIPGVYRFHFLVYRDEGLKHPFPLHQRVSSEFEVVK
jgi:hypothetical protein